MLIKKVTTGFVTQVYDTEAKCFVSQEFTAGEQVDWETMEGDTVNLMETDVGKEYLNFDMIQPPAPMCQIDFITVENQNYFRNGIILDNIRLVRDIMQIFRPLDIPLMTATNFINCVMVEVPRSVIQPMEDLGIRMRIIG